MADWPRDFICADCRNCAIATSISRQDDYGSCPSKVASVHLRYVQHLEGSTEEKKVRYV